MMVSQRRYFLLAFLAVFSNGNYVTLSDRYTADPAPFVYNGRLYIYTSHDLTNQTGWFMTDYSLMSTDDLVNWQDEGICFDIKNQSWGMYAWAQQVIAGSDGNFYMYYPGMNKRSRGNNATGTGVASSSSVAGPFMDAIGKPLLPCGDDPTVFRDDDGTVYLCGNCGGPLCAILYPNMTALKTVPTHLEPALPNWFEAPWLSKWKGTYYLSYMCQGNGLGDNSHYGWNICYGSCNGAACSPLGPYVFRGSLQWNPPNDCGPINASCADPHTAVGENNHQGIVEFPENSGRLYLAYHSRTLSKSRGAYLGFQRNVALDRLYARGDATTYPLPPGLKWVANEGHPGAGPGLLPVTSTPSWVRQLKYLNPYDILPGTTSALMSPGLNSEPCNEGGRNLGFVTDNATSILRGLDFGASPSAELLVRAATPLDGGSLRLEDQSGAILAECPIPSTGGWQTWVNYSCALRAPLIGIVPSITLRFLSSLPSKASFNLRYITFLGGQAPSPPRTPPPVAVAVSLRSAATGLYWEVQNGAAGGLVTPSSTSPVELTLEDLEDGTYTLRLGADFLCVSDAPAGGHTLAVSASATAASPCTRLFLYGTTTGSYGLLSATTGTFISGDGTSTTAPLAAVAVDPRTVPADAARHFFVEL